jgi:signal transduction histidine kinase
MDIKSEDIKERAYNKVRAKYDAKVREVKASDPFWSIDNDRATQFSEMLMKDAIVYSYILLLIEKDRT